MKLQLGSPVAVHTGRRLNCTELYEATTKIAPQAFVDLDGILHMIQARCSNVVSLPRLICLPRVSSADWPYYLDKRIAGQLFFMHMRSYTATQKISSVA